MRLAAIRQFKGLGADRVDQLAGLPPGATDAIEAGDRPAELNELVSLACVLDALPGDFFEGLVGSKGAGSNAEGTGRKTEEAEAFARAFQNLGDGSLRKEVLKMVKALADSLGGGN